MPFYGPFPRYTRVSRCSHKGETYWNNDWSFMSRMSLPLNLLCQSNTGKPSGLVVFCFIDMASATRV